MLSADGRSYAGDRNSLINGIWSLGFGQNPGNAGFLDFFDFLTNSVMMRKNLTKKEKNMSVISMKQLLEAGVHFGHQTRRWNPKMAPYIYTERNGIYIIDLQKSVGMVDDAYNAVADIVANGGTSFS